MHCTWFMSNFLRVFKFLDIKERGSNSWRELILQNVSIIWLPILYFNLKVFLGPNSTSFITYQYIPHHWRVVFLRVSEFVQIKEWRSNFQWNQFHRNSELFAPHCCISIWKVLWTQVFYHSLDFNVYFMMQEYVSKGFEISAY